MIKNFNFCSQEVRAVERRILLETLANELPENSVRFSSKLSSIERSKDGETLLELSDGTRLSAKVAFIFLTYSIFLANFEVDKQILTTMQFFLWHALIIL